jgi:lipid-binding SYLF domain-containing protein
MKSNSYIQHQSSEVDVTRHQHRGMLARLAVVALLFVVSVGAGAAVSVQQQREELRGMTKAALAEVYRQQPTAQAVIKHAAGYAVFSSFGTKLGVAGAGRGKGVAVNNSTGAETFMKALELQAGLGFGIKKYRLVWVFESQAAFDNFVTKGRQLGGNAEFSARAAGKGGGVAGAAQVEPGVWLYQLTDKGLAAEITIKASKYYKDKDLN